jgi:aminoglycoside phosphotransferase (APT) family kinase protein
MTDPALTRFEQVLQRMSSHNRLLRSWPLSGGISAEMTVLEYEDSAGQVKTCVLRRPGNAALGLNPRAAEEEYQVLRLARSAGLPVPTPLYLDGTGMIFPDSYLVIGYIAGAPDFSWAHGPDFAVQLAEGLAKIHAVEGFGTGLAYLIKSTPRLEAAVGERPAPSGSALGDARAWDVLRANWPIPRLNPTGLLHGDYWPGNILWQAGRLAAVVDWEDAKVGDPLEDFAISRLDFLWIYGRDLMEEFSRHYLALKPIDTRKLPYWDLYAALRLARLVGNDLSGWAQFFHPYGRLDIDAESIQAHVRSFIAQALEQVGV